MGEIFQIVYINMEIDFFDLWILWMLWRLQLAAVAC